VFSSGRSGGRISRREFLASSSLAAKGRYLPRTLSRNALPVSGNPIPAACRRNCVRKRWEKRRAYRLADKERLSAYPVWILSPGSCRPLFLPAPVASPSALRGVPIATTRSGVYGKRKCSSCSCFNGYLKSHPGFPSLRRPPGHLWPNGNRL